MSLPKNLAEIAQKIEKIARDAGLEPCETIFEMVQSEDINGLAAQEGFPVRYPHWRFGMNYDQYSKGYEWGLQKIYEMVINTDPAYAYLMSSNSMVDQKTVMAHVFGHVDFFQNNIWFSKTNRKMLDAMANNAGKIRRYMDLYGQDTVENFIDQCLRIDNLIDPQLPFREQKRSESGQDQLQPKPQEVGRLKVDRGYMEKFINPPEFLESQRKIQSEQRVQDRKFPAQPERDVMLFLMENAPLEEWERETLRVIRDESYYFVPQIQTKIMNEGWASYWHSEIMTKSVLDASEIIDFADHHAGVLAMSPGKLNPYKIGIELFRDIEDRWNRGRFGKEYEECPDLKLKANWDKKLGQGRAKIFEVRKVCNDVTFMDQYLTPEFVERFKLYSYEYNKRTNQHEIASRDFKVIKEKLLSQLTNQGAPLIVITDANHDGRGDLMLEHKHQGTDLDLQYAREAMMTIHLMWKRPVHITTTVEGAKRVYTYNKNEFTLKE